MLEQLRIQNVALIQEMEAAFGPGLNVLSGETGAGKSIIIDSIGFALGGRATKDFIRNGEEMAYVEALFTVVHKDTLDILREAGLAIDENGEVLISRSLSHGGKSACRINGRIVTLSMLKEITPLLIDLHGQHEHQSLLNPLKHIALVDTFCGEALDRQKAALQLVYEDYRNIAKAIQSIAGDERERLATLDLLSFQIDEIEKASLKPHEDSDLAERRSVLQNAEKLAFAADEVVELLYGGQSDELSAIDRIARALRHTESIAEVDGSKTGLSDSLSAIQAELEDAVAELRRYQQTLEFDPQELDHIESRLDQIYRLKRKYGATVDDILIHYHTIKQRHDFILNSEEEIQKLAQQKNAREKEIIAICKEMSRLRKQASTQIQRDIIGALQELGMKNVQFEIRFERKDAFSLNGFDKTEFYISPNQGEALKPLSKTASGGEMSRVMLALKAVLANVDAMETFIFDEIDTGVSGRTAQKVAEKLALLARNHQILCITHLPQIAAMADSHYLIEKILRDNRTITELHPLSGEQCIDEIARLTSGVTTTKTSRSAAAEMRRLAQQAKSNL